MLKTILFIVMAWQPIWYPAGTGPETQVEREDRWIMISEVVADVSNSGVTSFWPKDNVALLLTVFKFESRLGYYVHGGEPSLIGHQDRMKARCMGQIHKRLNVKDKIAEHYNWVRLGGRDRTATARCAVRVLQILRSHARRCLRNAIPQAQRWRAPMTPHEAGIVMAAYGSGNGCKAHGRMKPRIKMWKQVHEKLP